MDERFVDVGGLGFRVVLKPPVPFHGGLIACRGCGQLGKPMTVRHVAQVFGSFTGLELPPGTADWDLAANTFRREHSLAGPLCRRCRFLRTLKAIVDGAVERVVRSVGDVFDSGRRPARH